MTTAPIPQGRPGLSWYMAAEIRATAGRHNVSARQIAMKIGVPSAWMSRRIGRNADVDLTFEEVDRIAQALGVEAEGLIVSALRACRDSNPKPSVLYPAWGPVVDLAAWRERRTA